MGRTFMYPPPPKQKPLQYIKCKGCGAIGILNKECEYCGQIVIK